MSAVFAVRAASSAAGAALARRIAGRLAGVLDSRLERAAARRVERVRRGGDVALVDCVRELDGVEIAGPEELRLDPRVDGGGRLAAEEEAALEGAIARVETWHRARAARDAGGVLESGGLRVVEQVRPLRRVGVYVPGGLASYPSTAIMTIVPALVAGVEEIVVATPPRGWRERLALRRVLARLGVTEILGAGGAHGIAALAYGTESLRRVDLIVGPGNAWVTAAKRRVAGAVAIDGLMGPSEVVIVASAGADPERLAADLLAQAEHDERASALLITTSRRLARATAESVERRLAELASAPVARVSLARYGGALLAGSLDEAIALVERLAPEHLQLVGAEVESMAERFTCAGAVFVGPDVPEVLGDYVAGPSHVLPTCGSARFASGLSIESFRRRFHRIEAIGDGEGDGDRGGIAALAAMSATLARLEGLPAHAASASLRTAGAER
ncbi:MAG: histidinol dehydrogenase [Acidobacteriota bacterium]